MDRLLVIAFLFICCSCKFNKDDPHDHHRNMEPESHIHHQGYDDELAKELGADQYGMKKYVLAYLKAGPNRDQNPEEVASLQKAHLENIQNLADKGQLVLAGPFLDDGLVRGIYLFDVETIEDARILTNSDPMIVSGRLEMELHPWYGSAALKKVNQIHNTIQKTSISSN